MKYFLFVMTFVFISLGLTACGGGDDDNNNTDNNTPTTTPTSNTLSAIANNSATNEAIVISDVAPLTSNITALFGTANAEPVAIADNTTLNNVINSVQGKTF